LRAAEVRYIAFALTPTLYRRARELNVALIPQHFIYDGIPPENATQSRIPLLQGTPTMPSNSPAKRKKDANAAFFG